MNGNKVANDFLNTVAEQVASKIQPNILNHLKTDISSVQDKVLDVKEVAEVYGISDKKLYDMCKKKQIPHRRLGSRIVFSSAALDAWGREQDKNNYQPN
ncbi:helix-turn-helix domain-containing protein [Paenibacillus larvae]|uniref:DNA binding domain, excisionase family n=1 Tax=Paenibacillus larvae subsp. larvae TaxID=147375 RepID=A0A6C0QX91_9BACL|nr:helix-turn-helix domain-containing protein [Paenibacillus larvae]QHZ53399.1 DNA binding domain, excisionase family [Paenibacillus larvae subsp. larvae]